jgi:hypothetical protein
MVTPSSTRICESAEVTSTSEGFPGANCNTIISKTFLFVLYMNFQASKKNIKFKYVYLESSDFLCLRFAAALLGLYIDLRLLVKLTVCRCD